MFSMKTVLPMDYYQDEIASMWEEYEDSEHDYIEEVSQTTSKKPRGPGFTAEEDALLISAWLNTGLDPIQGNEQKHSSFWGKIHDYYNTYKTFDSDRSQVVLTQRWGKIQKLVNKYSGCLAAIYRRNESGMTEQDKLAKAKGMFEKQEKQKWNLDHAWTLLRHQPKWIQVSQELDEKNSKKKFKPHISSSSNVGIDIDTEEEISNPISRPLGKKAEKRKLKETSDQFELIQKLHLEKKERDEKKLEIMKEKIELEKEKLRVRKAEAGTKKFEAEMKIMSMDTSVMNNEQRAYYSKLQMKILQGDI